MRRESVVAGIAFVLLSSLVFAPVVQACSKYLLVAFPLVQVMWVRSTGHAAWMVVIFWRSHGLGMFKTKRPGLQFARSILLSGCSLVWLMAIPHVQLASAAAIMFTTPMFVALLSIPMLGERVGKHRFGAIALGFVGVLIVIRPGAGEMAPEMLLIVLGALMYAVYQILTRKVSVDDSAATSAVYAAAAAAICTSFFIPFNYRIPGAEDWPHWLGLLAISFFGGFRHLLMVKAFEHARASVVSPFCYTELIGVSILGVIMFGELPDRWTWAGAALIVASGLYIAHRESRAAKSGP
jgi:drug/metabolite transporter (DMT)-like permease